MWNHTGRYMVCCSERIDRSISILQVSNVCPSGCLFSATTTDSPSSSELTALDAMDIDFPTVSIDAARDVNLLPFSSGTTGAPKVRTTTTNPRLNLVNPVN